MASESSDERRVEQMHPSLRCSVIIPTYNTERFISDAVQSVFEQTEPNIEIIVVDDGSTDRTLERLQAFESQCPDDWHRLIIVNQPNKGAAAARNSGIRAARAPYLGFLDADDLWHPTMVETLGSCLDAYPEIDIVHCGVRIVDERGRDTGIRGRLEPGLKNFADVLLIRSLGQPSAVMVRRTVLEVVGYFDEDQSLIEDLDLWLRIAAYRDRNILALGEVLVDYRRHSQQVTQNWQRHLHRWKEVVAKAKKCNPELVVPVEREAYGRLALMCAAEARDAGDRGAALTLIFQAWIRAWPKFAFELAAWRKTLGALLCWLPRPVFTALRRVAHYRDRRNSR